MDARVVIAGFQPRDRLESDAADLASRLHRGQTDKRTGAPYVEHPFRVASRVQRWGGSSQQVAAALLHDTLEDAPPGAAAPAEIAALDRHVLDLVVLCSDHTPGDGPAKAPWLPRKTDHLASLGDAVAADPALVREVLPIVAADKIDAMTRTTAALHEAGTSYWSMGLFKGGRLGTLWYYASMVAFVQAHLPVASPGTAGPPGAHPPLDEAAVGRDLQRAFGEFAAAAGAPDAGRDRDGLLRRALEADPPEGIERDQRGATR